MSIDKAFADLTAALNATTAAILGMTQAKGTPTSAPTEPKPEKKKTEPKPAAAKPETKTLTEQGNALLPDVKKAILALAERDGRDAAVAILKDFGVEKVPELKPTQLENFLKAVNAKLAATPAEEPETDSLV